MLCSVQPSQAQFSPSGSSCHTVLLLGINEVLYAKQVYSKTSVDGTTFHKVSASTSQGQSSQRADNLQ